MPLAVPLCAPPGSWAYIALLDTAPIDIDLCEDAPVTVGAERAQPHLARSNKRPKPLLGCTATRLIELCRVHVGEPHLLAIADKGVAIDSETSFARLRA